MQQQRFIGTINAFQLSIKIYFIKFDCGLDSISILCNIFSLVAFIFQRYIMTTVAYLWNVQTMQIVNNTNHLKSVNGTFFKTMNSYITILPESKQESAICKPFLTISVICLWKRLLSLIYIRFSYIICKRILLSINFKKSGRGKYLCFSIFEILHLFFFYKIIIAIKYVVNKFEKNSTNILDFWTMFLNTEIL